MSAIVTEARSWIGVPFRHQGRTRRGVDCAGLAVCVGVACGVLAVPGREMLRYGLPPNPRHIGQMLDALGVQVQAAEPGDVLWFGHPRAPTHLGIWTGASIIHADNSSGRVHEGPLHEAVRAVYRYPGMIHVTR